VIDVSPITQHPFDTITGKLENFVNFGHPLLYTNEQPFTSEDILVLYFSIIINCQQRQQDLQRTNISNINGFKITNTTVLISLAIYL